MGQVITANRLSDGVVVFLDDAGHWSERLDQAQVFDDKAASALGLEAGRAAEARNLILDLNAIDVATRAGSIVPIKLRRSHPGAWPHHLARIRQARIHPAHRQGGRPCIGMTSSTPSSWRSGSRSSATRRHGASRAT